MSDSNRHLTGGQPTLSGARMITPVTQAGVSPVAIPVAPNPYGLIPAPPHHQFMPHLTYNQLPNVQNRMPFIGTIPPTMPGMYVSVAQVPRTPMLATQMTTVQLPPGVGAIAQSVDPSKLLEQQRKIEKERNFQLQQQKLKQFTVAGKKGSLNADNLIDSMFGKNHPKESAQHSTSVKSKPIDNSQIKQATPSTLLPTAVTSVPFEAIFSAPTTANTYSSPVTNPHGCSVTKQEKKDKKELHAMMLECSNLSGPQKANKFSKLPVKEITPTSQSRPTFTASNKARDWRDIKGLDEVFVEKRPRFPPWCCKEKVHEIYHKVESIVTENGAHVPETSLLFPILVSSGLPQQALAQIWEMVNQSASGSLTVEEMYAALALIAVLQSGHAVKTIDILYHLPSCPVPRLQCFANPVEAGNVEKQPNQSSSEAIPPYSEPNSISDSSSYQVVRPTTISLKKDNVSTMDSPSTADNFSASKLPPISSSGFISSPDDEFDDFKSATPTCVNFMMHSSSISNSSPQEDEFDDFKQAPTAAIVVDSKNEFSKTVAGMTSAVPQQDLMSPEEDKYSVFRHLQQSESTDDWADFSSTSLESTKSVPPSFSSEKKCPDTSTVTVADFNSFRLEKKVAVTESNIFDVKVESKEEDDFGDFLSAETKQESNMTYLTTELQKINSNFADFSNFSDNISAVPALNVPGNSQTDDEFCEFTSSFPVSNKVELGQEFLFRHLKDNISLTESQSVSSLELGTFDGGGHSGESKSSLSRQGSIPSLDLKSSCLEVNESEDCFGDFQNAPVPARVASTPSPVKEFKGIECNNLSGVPLGSNFQSSKIVPLTDKYSAIRSEEKKEEDQHISIWTRCLQSSVNILQNTKKIFNQMSCSSVCNEVLSSEEGGNYIKDVIEVYKVACRIKFSSKSYSKQSITMIDLLKEVEQIWNCICVFFAGSSLMPQESSFDFSSSLLRINAADNTKACGLCLLNAEVITSKNEDCSLKLSYGGRNYHSTCANFWVNCVDPLLPALTLPQLL